jgi:hypothetical protein
MAQTRRVLTDEQREQRRAHQRELVLASIEQLRTSEGWQAYLDARTRFSSYSWRNVLLILSQHPTAERVAGFRAWLELGYCLTKRSTGIRIWARCAPSRKRMRAWRDAGANPQDKPCATYKLVSVFAQDQVAELPPPATPAPLTAPIAEIRGDSHERPAPAGVLLRRQRSKDLLPEQQPPGDRTDEMALLSRRELAVKELKDVVGVADSQQIAASASRVARTSTRSCC